MRMKINLLPTKFSKKRASALQELVIICITVAVTLVSLVVWWYVMAQQESTLTAETAKLQEQINSLKKEVVRVDEFKQKAKDLESKLMVIEELKAMKTGPVHLLDDLATIITRVGDVWITSISESQGTMTIELGALTQDKISLFMESLTKGSKYFSSIQLMLTEARVGPKPGQNYFYFKLQCRVHYAAS